MTSRREVVLGAVLAVSLGAAGCARGCRPEDSRAAQQGGAAGGAPQGAASGPTEGAQPAATGAAAPQAPAGSGAAAASGQAGTIRRVPACTLVARREVAEILGSGIGKPIAEESTGVTECTYPPAQIAPRTQAHVTIAWDSPRTGPSIAHQLADAGQGTEPGPQVAQHVALGDEADWSLDGELSVRTGNTLITVSVSMGPESRRQTEAIARKIVDRLAGAPLPDLTNDAPSNDDDTLPSVDDLVGATKVH